MRKKILLFTTVLSLLSITTLFSQVASRNYFGIEIGLNNSLMRANGGYIFPYRVESLDFNGMLGFTDLGMGIGFHGGLTLDYAFNKNFGLIFKALYQRRNATNTEQQTLPCPDIITGTSSNVATLSNTYSATSDYINADILFKFGILPDSWYGFGGVNLASILSNKFSGSSRILSSTSGTCQFRSASQGLVGTEMIIPEQELSDFYNKLHTSIKFGVGTYIPVGSNGTVLTPELSLNAPITELLSSNHSITLTNTNLGFSPFNLMSAALTLGIKFPFGENKAQDDYENRSENNGREAKPGNNDQSKPDNYNVTGIVKDAKTGKPIQADISIVDLNKDEEVASTTTDKNGKYKAKLEGKGKYSVTATAPGYIFSSSLFEIDDNGRLTRKGNGDILMMSSDEDGKTTLLVFFDTDKATLQRSSYPELNRAASFLKANPNLNVEIAGHTDNRGSADYNKNLSLKRAKAVSDYLTSKGVSASQLSQAGYGLENPVASNDTEEGRADNRRVEFVVKKK